MRFFISSVIAGFESQRRAAIAAIQALGHETITAEQFSASPTSPQIACMEGVRRADAIILLLGERYGTPQASGKSPTHEEFDEAKSNKPVFAFVQSGATVEDRQRAFIAEVRPWVGGVYTENFSDDADLERKITRAVHEWIVSRSAGPVDSQEMRDRALAALPEQRRGYSSRRGPTLVISVVGAPNQPIIRPSQLEELDFRNELMQRAFFGSPSVFTPEERTKHRIEEHALNLDQENASLRVSEDGAILIVLPLPPHGGSVTALIEEDVRALLGTGLTFISQTLNKIDPTNRMSHVAIAAAVLEASHAGWRTREEQRQNPNSITLPRMFDDSTPVVTLSPPHLSRSAFSQQIADTAQDITVLLRRLLQGN